MKKDGNNDNSVETKKFKSINTLSFEHYCSIRGNNISFKLIIDLIENNNLKSPKQFILIKAFPYVMKNKNFEKEEYLDEIKKTLTYSIYQEKFSFLYFIDNSIQYKDLKEDNLIKVFYDIIKSEQEKKSKIINNKYNLIYIYYINKCAIFLSLRNKKEYNIFEKFLNEKDRDESKLKDNNNEHNLIYSKNIEPKKKPLNNKINNNYKNIESLKNEKCINNIINSVENIKKKIIFLKMKIISITTTKNMKMILFLNIGIISIKIIKNLDIIL